MKAEKKILTSILWSIKRSYKKGEFVPSGTCICRKL